MQLVAGFGHGGVSLRRRPVNCMRISVQAGVQALAPVDYALDHRGASGCGAKAFAPMDCGSDGAAGFLGAIRLRRAMGAVRGGGAGGLRRACAAELSGRRSR